ncbi:MAG: hypothetical protein M3516_02770 [Actinomycetota bacterium]|nr:hypothetical protein [Actinomycetota bacterium]
MVPRGYLDRVPSLRSGYRLEIVDLADQLLDLGRGGIAMATDGPSVHVSGTPETSDESNQTRSGVPGKQGDVIHDADVVRPAETVQRKRPFGTIAAWTHSEAVR